MHLDARLTCQRQVPHHIFVDCLAIITILFPIVFYPRLSVRSVSVFRRSELFELSPTFQREPHLRLQKCRSYFFLLCVRIESGVIFFFVSERAGRGAAATACAAQSLRFCIRFLTHLERKEKKILIKSH